MGDIFGIQSSKSTQTSTQQGVEGQAQGAGALNLQVGAGNRGVVGGGTLNVGSGGRLITTGNGSRVNIDTSDPAALSVAHDAVEALQTTAGDALSLAAVQSQTQAQLAGQVSAGANHALLTLGSNAQIQANDETIGETQLLAYGGTNTSAAASPVRNLSTWIALIAGALTIYFLLTRHKA